MYRYLLSNTCIYVYAYVYVYVYFVIYMYIYEHILYGRSHYRAEPFAEGSEEDRIGHPIRGPGMGFSGRRPRG